MYQYKVEYTETTSQRVLERTVWASNPRRALAYAFESLGFDRISMPAGTMIRGSLRMLNQGKAIRIGQPSWQPLHRYQHEPTEEVKVFWKRTYHLAGVPIPQGYERVPSDRLPHERRPIVPDATDLGNGLYQYPDGETCDCGKGNYCPEYGKGYGPTPEEVTA